MQKIKIGEQELRKVEILGGMSYEEQLRLVFREGDYVGLVLWVYSPAGRLALPDYFQNGWAMRAAMLREIVPWYVFAPQLRIVSNRLLMKKRVR